MTCFKACRALQNAPKGASPQKYAICLSVVSRALGLIYAYTVKYIYIYIYKCFLYFLIYLFVYILAHLKDSDSKDQYTCFWDPGGSISLSASRLDSRLASFKDVGS